MTSETALALAVRFRKLMEELDRSQWGTQFRGFPRGSCGAATEMFGTYLFEECDLNAKYISAVHRDNFSSYGSHAWLELGNLIIDLTCDQFSHDPLPAPYVGRDSIWHSQWAVETKAYMEVWLQINRTQMFAAWGAAYMDLLRHLHRR